MKKVILLAVIMPYITFGQIVENFESGTSENWVQMPEDRWKADTTESISGMFSLHHCFDNEATGNDQAAIRLNNIHPSEGTTRWSFTLRHGYDPSSSNNWSVFLFSDNSPGEMSAEGGASGFIIGVNLTGYDDTLRLCKKKGSIITTVVASSINWQSSVSTSNHVKIIVERSPEGLWSVTVLKPDGELLSKDYGSDKELFTTSWLGISYRYTSTRDMLLWFDDLNIEGIFYEDHQAPSVTALKITGRNSLQITFDEPISPENLSPSNFSLNNPEAKPASIRTISESACEIVFPELFINKEANNILINKFCDIAGNCSMNHTIAFTPAWVEAGDVVITEIMADPVPEVSLPGNEYIEITNRSGFAQNMKNWIIRCGDQVAVMPEIVIKPSEIFIICSNSDTLAFRNYGKTAGLKKLPSLNDGGSLIVLTDSLENLIHGVDYTSECYGDKLKSGGGWSLEMIDADFPFYDIENWKASKSRTGGSPGSQNSIAGNNPDYSFKGIQNVFPYDSLKIIIRFSEPVFNIVEKKGSIKIDGKSVKELRPSDPLCREFSIIPEKALKTGMIYNIEIPPDLTDFAINLIQNREFRFGLPEVCLNGDLLFNELLFNPLPGDPDYIEFYNRSGKIIDASRLQIASISGSSSDTSGLDPLSAVPVCILPGAYYAITADRPKICERYFSTDPAFLHEATSIPSMSDDEGHLILYNTELDLIDEVTYDSKMHYSLLANYEGVALEKIGPLNISTERTSWHSASESSGWGTPGARNSIYTEMPGASEKIEFSSTRITPDSDGYEDILSIRLNLADPGNVVSVSVYDESGNYVRKIAENMLAGAESTLVWDATASDGSAVETGIYIFLIAIYNDTGKTSRWKKICTVIR